MDKSRLAPNGKVWVYSPSEAYNNKVWDFKKYLGFPNLIDRTETIDFGHDIKIVNTIPENYRNFNKSFADICDERGEEIKNKTDKPISVLWSGGIDSTVAIVSLMKAGAKVNVLYSQNSIDEYPNFFKQYQNHPLLTWEHDLRDEHFERWFDKDQLFVTGELGDQIFGSDKMMRIFDKINEPYHLLLNDNMGEIIEPQLKFAPIEIKTIYDFLWWMNFSLKYQFVLFRIYSVFHKRLKWGDLEHFFMAQDFQKWSMVNHDMKIKTEMDSYKWIAKDYIFDFTGDASYRDNKLKHGSLWKNMPEEFCILCSGYLTTNFIE